MITATLGVPTMEIVTIETPSLGDRTYVVHDGQHAAIIDPQRDLDRVLAVLAESQLTLVAVLETHVHNDYVSGGLELSRTTGAAYHLPADARVDYEHVPTSEGTEIDVGVLHIRAMHTPGHTPDHVSYVASQDGQDAAVFTGGSLLFGSVGRTDLIGASRTEELSRAQYRSAWRLAQELADEVAVLPTHGFGSFCSSGDTSGATSSSIGQERRDNQALRTQDESLFVAELLAGLDAFPSYYAHMAPANLAGPAPIDLTEPAIADPSELARRIHNGEWVIDLRTRRAFADGHFVGTINAEISDSFSTYIGWLIPWGTPVTLLGETSAEVAEAQRQLTRIGIDRPAAQARSGGLQGHLEASYSVATFAAAQLARDARDDVVILDVRRTSECNDGRVAGSTHVPLHELLERLDDVPAGEVWVHCQSGYRAGIAASLLDRAGRSVVLIDEDFSAAQDLVVGE
jgi:hydroxyacylglutathione hydrolase